MCGVALALDLRGGRAPLEAVRRMLAALGHRGPDGEGLAALGPLALGHRRLAILDLSPLGAQPMALRDGRRAARPEATDLVVAHNGEVYDWLERRAELEQQGAAFETRTDTEVLLQAYARWGSDCFARLRGMWAAALWDGPNRRLVLSRDRFGIKPLYLLERDGVLYAASEVKALLAAVPSANQVDPAVLGRFLLAGAQDEGPRTFFRDVRQLAPATTLVVEADGRRAEQVYWRFDRERARATFDYARPAATLRRLLEEAVELHLRSDVPVGTCLSGGLDSSAVVALAAARTRQPVRTFTAVYDDAGLDERRFAREVVARFGCDATEVSPRPGRDLVPLLDRIGWFHDEPCARPGLVTQWHVMESARGKVTVLLDGQGGDELLLGYAYYALPYLRTLGREALRGPNGEALVLKLLRDAAGLLGASSSSSGGSGSLLRLLARGAARRLRGRRPRLSPALVEAARALAPPDEHRGETRIDALLQDDLERTSIPALLHHEDRASMAFSLEARVPLLDHVLAEFCLGLDYKAKVEGAKTKAVLRRALDDLLPRSILDRTDKLGYPTPIGRWLLEAAADVKEVLLFGWAERGHVPSLDVTRAWLELERSGGRRGDPWLLYRWLTTELWLQRFIDRPPAPPPLEVALQDAPA